MQNHINKHMAALVDLEKILELTTMHLYWLDSNNIYQGCNDMQAKSAGLASRFDIIGKKNSEIPWGKNYPEIAEKWDKVNLEVLSSGKPKFIEEYAVFLDGKRAVFLSHKLPLKDSQGKIIGLFGLSIDITNQKDQQDKWKNEKEQVELTLEHIIANLPNHVYWKNKAGVYLGSNNLQAKSLGLSLGQEIIGKTDFDLPGDKESAFKFRENDIKVMQAGEIITVEEAALVGGKPALVLSQKMPLKNMHGEIVGILGISTDITERKRMEQEIIRAKEKAEEANKFKIDFLYNMRHDIRTPFNGLLGMSEYLWDKATEPESKEFLGYIKQSAKELLDYFEDILDYLKIEQEVDNNLLLKKFCLKELVDKMITIEVPAAKDKHLRLSLEYSEEIPRVLISDRYKLYRILINLVSNAIKFTEEGHVTIKVNLIPTKDEREVLVRFAIEDSGIGIPKEKMDYIYEKFTRLIPSGTSSHRGMGLGLTVVKELVAIMGGEIDVQSKLGEGTTFNCTLPFIVPLTEDFVEEDLSLLTKR